jgi:hypothetical protein
MQTSNGPDRKPWANLPFLDQCANLKNFGNFCQPIQSPYRRPSFYKPGKAIRTDTSNPSSESYFKSILSHRDYSPSFHFLFSIMPIARSAFPQPFKTSHIFFMVLGTCVIFTSTGRSSLKPESISITGEQDGFIVVFTVKQLFRHTSPSTADVRYIVPNNSKICIYDTTFRIGSRVIKVVLQAKQAATEIFVKAKDHGRAALLGQQLGNGLVEFTLGNLPSGEPCEVEVKCAFVASSSGLSETYFKFPLDVCTPRGSVNSITENLTGPFHFSVRNRSATTVSKIEANVPHTSESGLLTISQKPSAASIIVTTEFNLPFASLCLTAGRYFALTKFTPQFSDSNRENDEFIFVIDCSGSMSGQRIARARECLSLFIRSLPSGSFFNIVRFGSNFKFLFPESVNYNNETSKQGLAVAQNMNADFGGTEIYDPLFLIFEKPFKGQGIRQLFVITDGEVSNTDQVIELARRNAVSNRCFSIGLGGGADAGLVQGIADATGGRADFVSEGEDLTEKVIGQLETSLCGGIMTNVSIEVSNVGGIQFAPFPIPSISAAVAQTVFGRCPSPLGRSPILVSGDLFGERIDEVVESKETDVGEEVLKALFAYETIKKSEANLNKSRFLRERIIQLSIESGVLCGETRSLDSQMRFSGFNPVRSQLLSTANLMICAQKDSLLHHQREDPAYLVMMMFL